VDGFPTMNNLARCSLIFVEFDNVEVVMPSAQWLLDQDIRRAKFGVPLDDLTQRVDGLPWQEIYDVSASLVHQWSQYVYDFADWSTFITITFQKEYSRDTVHNFWRSIVQQLNRELYGNHYTRIVGHSYFSYCVAFEKQQRGAYHLHLLTSGFINYKMIHDYCNHENGRFAWIVSARDKKAVSVYVSKYVVKEGDLLLYRALKQKVPAFKPNWLLAAEAAKSRR